MLREFDQHFTPKGIANDIRSILINNYTDLKVDVIADFTAGEGILLQAVEGIYDSKEIYANDIDVALCKKMKAESPHWHITNFDFEIDTEMINSLPVADLIVLNPPFSKKGKRNFCTSFQNEELKCSYSVLHLVNALNKLSNAGILVCILPESVLHSQRDQHIWERINQYYFTNVENEYPDWTFPYCNASTVLVTFRKLPEPKEIKSTPCPSKDISGILITRGWHSMHKISDNRFPSYLLLHTTSISSSGIDTNLHTKSARVLVGEHLIIPRVGRPKPEKLVIYKSASPFVLSDCLISVQSTKIPIQEIEKSIKSDNDFFRIYTGTGAKYVSIKTIDTYMNNLVAKFT